VIFFVERPIRHYERLSDVQASWNKDKLMNILIARLTVFAPLLAESVSAIGASERNVMLTALSLQAIPSSSPIHSGYVEWESKRGKWSKRWLQLRGQSLWMSKHDNVRGVFLAVESSSHVYIHTHYRGKTRRSCVLYPTLTSIILADRTNRRNRSCSLSNRPINCPFLRTRRIISMLFRVRRRRGRFGWTRFYWLVYVVVLLVRED